MVLSFTTLQHACFSVRRFTASKSDLVTFRVTSFRMPEVYHFSCFGFCVFERLGALIRDFGRFQKISEKANPQTERKKSANRALFSTNGRNEK